jgi:hypothetical protein
MNNSDVTNRIFHIYVTIAYRREVAVKLIRITI